MLTSAVDPVYSPTFGDLIAPLPAPIQVMTSDLVDLFARHPGVTKRGRFMRLSPDAALPEEAIMRMLAEAIALRA